MRAECLIAFDEKENQNGGLISSIFNSFTLEKNRNNTTELSTVKNINIFTSLSFNGFDLEREIKKSILFINSLEKDTQLIINILTHDLYNVEDVKADAFIALFTAIEYSQLNFIVHWHTNIEHIDELCTIWRTIFPFLLLFPIDLCTSYDHLNLQLPHIGSCQSTLLLDQSHRNLTVFISLIVIPVQNYDPILFSNLHEAIFVDTFHKDQLCAFFDTKHSIQLSQVNMTNSSKTSVLDTSTFGFLFKIEKLDKIAFVFFDLSIKEFTFINSAYTLFIYNLVTKRQVENEIANRSSASVSFSNNSFIEKSSFSDSVDAKSNLENIKRQNKETLKKLILLSLRRIGIKKNDSQFPIVWKHLYCGCIFSLRNDLGVSVIEQSKLLQTIRENVKFLNIK